VSQGIGIKIDPKSCFIHPISIISSILMQFIFNLIFYFNFNVDSTDEIKFKMNFLVKVFVTINNIQYDTVNPKIIKNEIIK
jgi:hypothetical protein